MSKCSITDIQLNRLLNSLQSFHYLEQLELNLCDRVWPYQGCLPLEKFRIKKLALNNSYNWITSSAEITNYFKFLPHLANTMTELEIKLEGCKVKDEYLMILVDYIKSLKKLGVVKLSLSENQITYLGMDEFESLKSIQSLKKIIIDLRRNWPIKPEEINQLHIKSKLNYGDKIVLIIHN